MKSSYAHGTGKKRRWPFILLVTGVIVLAVIVSAVLIIRRTYEVNLRPVSTSQQVQQITIPTGSSVKEIADMLHEAKLIRASWAFEWYVRNNDARDQLLAGTYALRSDQSVPDIVAILTHGKVSTDLVTILPGRRLDEIRQDLINHGFKEADVEAALDPKQYVDHPALVDKPAEASLEGYIYPESFQKIASTQPQVIVSAALDELQEILTPGLRAGIVRQGLTVHQGIILASIIEQEVGLPEDKKTVAQVFLKRLREGIRLESDPTAKYGAILAGKPPSLTYDSPYNSYKYDGLIPGPISNVSKSSLEAVANPASTDYLFFVAADPDEQGNPGKTYFSRTIEEHEALTRQYCKKLCS